MQTRANSAIIISILVLVFLLFVSVVQTGAYSSQIKALQEDKRALQGNLDVLLAESELPKPAITCAATALTFYDQAWALSCGAIGRDRGNPNCDLPIEAKIALDRAKVVSDKLCKEAYEKYQ